jgi:hypothetical protein
MVVVIVIVIVIVAAMTAPWIMMVWWGYMTIGGV